MERKNVLKQNAVTMYGGEKNGRTSNNNNNNSSSCGPNNGRDKGGTTTYEPGHPIGQTMKDPLRDQ